MKSEEARDQAAYSRMLAYDRRFDYLEQKDRYYLARPEVVAKLAVIGLGVNGRGHIVSALTEGRSVIRGIYDPHEGSVQAAIEAHQQVAPAGHVLRYRTVDEAVEDGEVDGYIVATPNYTHLDVLKKVLEAGKPVFLEKPMASTVTDARTIMELVRRSKARVQVGLQYRYKAMYVEAIAELLERRSIGEIKTLRISEHRIPFLDKVEQWNKFSELSGGTLVEKCCHYFDLFNLFAQARPTCVLASGSQAVNYPDFEYRGRSSDILDNADVIVEYANGVRANFDLCMFAPMFYEELVACGTGGRLRTYEQEDFTSADSFKSSLEIHPGEMRPARYSEPRYAGVIRQLGHSGADFFAQSAFVDFIQDPEAPVPTVEEGLWSVVVGAAAEAAIERGAAVSVASFLREHGITELAKELE